jgi:uncharacterized protein YydD (DUF2326 family)
MKLCKIYSNKAFHNVKFSEGLNVIIGNISNRDDSKKDTHNLGKSLLLEVIDFLLLKGIQNKDKYFLTKNKIFSNYIFFAEIELNNGQFLIIKRTVARNTKISFKLNKTKLAGFDIDIDNWDEVDLVIKEAKKYLNNCLAFDILPNWEYRKSLTYFMRHQEDFTDVFKLSKFKGPHKGWKPMVFDLLGFDGSLIKDKLELEEKYTKLKDKIKLLETENKVSTDDEDKIRGLIDIKQDERLNVSSQIDMFNFNNSDNKEKTILVDEVENSLKITNTRHYAIKHEISKIEKSLDIGVDNIDMKEISSIYEEVKLFFPSELLVEFDKVVEFNRGITHERNKFLQENLSALRVENIEIESLLTELEETKSNMLVDLTDKDSYEKFKKYQKQLSNVEAEVIIFEDKLDNISKMTQMKNELSDLTNNIKVKITELNQAIFQQNHKEIRKLFNQFTIKVLNTPAILSVRTNTENNIEFEAEYQSRDSLASSDLASGNTYKKVLCASFDISLLQHYNDKSFYKFAYHDGALDSLDIRKKEKYIEFVRNLVEEFNIQYIITTIESEVSQLKDTARITDDEICLMLSDTSCESKLFKQCF